MKKSLWYLLGVMLLVPVALLAAGQAGSMLIFDGTNDAGLVVDNPLLDNLTGNYTIEAWFKATGYTNNDRILDRNGVFALALGPNNTIQFLRPSSPELASPNNTVTAGWHHVAVRVQTVGVNYVGTLFFDGNPVATLNHPSLLLPASSQPVYIGNRTGFDRPLNGSLDEIRIWSVARTDAEIKSSRALPLTGAEAGLLAYYKLDEGAGQTAGDATVNNLDAGLGSDPLLADVNDPVWAASTAPIGMNLLAPNSGTLAAGTPLNVTWAVNPELPTVHILFSFDGGVKWYLLAANVPNNGTYATVVPGYPTTQLRYRVSSPLDGTLYDDSDANITVDMTGFVPSSITKEGEEATLASNMYVGVDGRAFGCKFIFSSRDVSSKPGIGTINFTVANPGLYVIWARALGAGSTRNSWLVKVDGGSEYVWDTNKGYKWTWDRISDRGTTGVPNVSAQLDPVYFYLTAGNHTIQFRGKEHYTRLDRFVVTNNLTPDWWGGDPTKMIHITAPPEESHADIVRNTPYEIKWISSNISSKVTIEFQKHDTDTDWILIAKNTPNDGSYIWTAPDELLDKAHIRISEEDGECPVDQTWETVRIINPPPEILVTKPNGGETFYFGDKTNITWINKNYSGAVNVLYSIDNGKAWVGLASNLTNTGTYEWTLPQVDSDSCLVKVVDKATGIPVDVSDKVFTIKKSHPLPGGITVSEPNGGEQWEVGSTHAITWTVENFDSPVNILLSIDNGANWSTLANNIAALGVYEWTVPNTLSTQCLIKVAEATTGTPVDLSDKVFSIVAAGSIVPAANYALSFDGINDLVTVPNAPSLNISGAFTIEFWMKTDQPAQSWRRILEKGSYDEYYISFYGATNRMCGAVRTSIPGGTRMTNLLGPSTALVTSNTWLHVAGTFDGTTAKMYINGVLQSTRTGTAAPRNLLSDLIIGAAKHGDIYEYHFRGVLDDLQLWNIARSETEIKATMFSNLSGTEAGLAAYYPFNEGSGQVVYDLTPNNNDGRMGKLAEVDESDPTFVLSDRPTALASLAALPVAALLAEEEAELMVVPEQFALLQNYPNPFNAGTTITYEVPTLSNEQIQVRLDIFDLQGRTIRTLVNGPAQPGQHQVHWDGANDDGLTASSGVYFFRLHAGSFVETKRMIMLK
ncbi:MAG TPA: FlgD immunoglobulin-like domain containing protein [bacterium]|nr:FlgD immunoglobulin-like domain containing protein [bacterium]HQJ64473.1 FlgD immunoglobulin-like domain containing protein [bacterium]